MKTIATTLAIAVTAFVGLSETTQADNQRIQVIQPRVAPNPGEPPKLGFLGQFEYGRGVRVVRVFWNTPAQRMGLEPGDRIVSINRQRILSPEDYFEALYNSGGRVTLLVRDVRTWRYVMVNGYLDLPPMPVYRSMTKDTGKKATPKFAPKLKNGSGQF